MALQKQVNIDLAVGVAGDFASVNPQFTLLAGRKMYRVGAAPVVIGAFAAADTVTGLVSNTITTGKALGFVGRQSNQAVITNWLGAASMAIPQGSQVTLYSKGDFYVTSADAAVFGDKVFALNATGEIKFSATTVADATDTGFTVAIGGAAGEIVTISK